MDIKRWLPTFLGFPLGAALSLAIMTSTALVLAPNDVSVDHLSQVALPTSIE